ncbi:T9SS type A sorting domain-containing protein [Flavobacterium sp.]|uniref:T9SS type A sorting domain-containing protein n=1 Tax=Flavobacterium sp. TaxID=239 RepID=UPI0039E437ED
MRKFLLFAGAFAFAHTAFAQDYRTLQITSGYSTDVIANGVGSALLSTTDSFDLSEFVLMSADYQLLSTDPVNSFALPVSGLIDNLATPGLSYQLAPYTGDNSLRLLGQFDSGTMNISNAVPSTAVYVLAACGNGSATLGGTIHFSDNTTQEIATGVIPDWFFSNALPVVATGFGRVGRMSDIVENPAGDPRLYQFQINILAENQTKTITSIDFNKQSFEEGVINILALSAQDLGTCPAPTQLNASAITNNTAAISWTAPVILPGMGYQYYLSANSVPPTASTTPTDDTDLTLLNLSSLITGQSYCVWVRSRCGETDFGPWSDSICFTTGQTSGVYNGGDISTTYVDFVDVTTTTNCPGVFTVTVPDGYVVTSVATSYDMQTALNGWMSEQRSLLVCNTTGVTETEVTSGVGGTTGTYSYERSGLDIADGATGTVEFELRAWRTYGAGECDVVYNRVVNGTWTVTVTYTNQLIKTKEFGADSFAIYPNPAHDVVNITAKENISEVGVYNLLGQQVLQKNNVNNNEIQLSTAGLPSGKYLVKITSENGVTTKSILKN